MEDVKENRPGRKVCGFAKSVTPVVLRTPSVTLFVSYYLLSNASKK